MTYEGTRGSAIGHRYEGNLHLLKAKRYEAVLLPGYELLGCDDADAPQWVTYQYSIPPCPTAQCGNWAGATADSSMGRGNRSRLYELNLWMRRYGRGQPCRVTVEEAQAEQRRSERLTEARKSSPDVEAAAKRYCMVYTMVYCMVYTIWYITWYISHDISFLKDMIYHGIHHGIYHMAYTIWYTSIASWYIPSKTGIHHRQPSRCYRDAPRAVIQCTEHLSRTRNPAPGPPRSRCSRPPAARRRPRRLPVGPWTRSLPVPARPPWQWPPARRGGWTVWPPGGRPVTRRPTSGELLLKIPSAGGLGR
jgi:hypothetical protein